MTGTNLQHLLPRRLQLQAVVIVSLLLIAVIALYAWFTATTQAQYGIDSFTEQTSIIAKNFAAVAAGYLLVEDFASIENFLLKIAEFPNIISILVCNRDGRILSKAVQDGSSSRASYEKEPAGPPAAIEPVATMSGDRITAWHPISGKKHLGWVRVEFSLDPLMVLKRRIWRSSLYAGVPSVAAGVFLILLFLSRPIQAIRKTSAFARRLDELKGETLTVEAGSREIELLVASLNNASLKLREQDCSLRESEQKYRTLFEESMDGIFVSTPEGRILDMNNAGVGIFGASSLEELKAADVGRDLYTNPQDREAFRQAMEGRGYIKDYGLKLRRLDGEIIDALVTATAIRSESGEIVSYRGILRDVTAQKKLELQLHHAQKMEAVGQLTGGIAHDFNNILTAIIGFGYLLRLKMERDDPRRTYAEQILATAEKAANLTQSLLAFSRKQVTVRQPLGVNAVIQRMRELLTKIMDEDVELVMTLAPGELTVMADGGQIEQVIMNLAANARDAMPNGGLLSISTGAVDLDAAFILAHGFGRKGRHALVTVSDTGTGMDENTVKRVFEPFFTTKEVGKGTGLGLSIVYGIVKQHDGFITVYSEPGQGTTVKIYLPLFTGAAVEPGGREAEYRKGGTETILVVEDDAEVRKFTVAALSEFGYKVIEAVDGVAAVSMFREHAGRIGLVIMDVVMPRKNGKEACDEIKKIRPDARVLFTSGYTADIVHKKGILDEGLDFVSKPLSPTRLLKTVREILDR
jgi:PAS domain S-box-containing protein